MSFVGRTELILIVVGPIVLRPVIEDDARYLAACVFYAVMLAIGKHVFSSLDIKGDDNE